MSDDRLRDFADKVEIAIKARDFRDDWGPFDVQQSCAEMIHEQLAEFIATALPPTERGVRETLTFDAWWNWFKGSLGSVTPRDVSIACSAWNQARALAAAAQPTDKEAGK